MENIHAFIDDAIPKTYRRNDPDVVKEVLRVARSYFNARYDSDGNPILAYGTDSCLSKTYTGDNHIDCSTFIGLVLRGISIQDSAYAKFIKTNDSSDEDPDEDPDSGDDDEGTDDYTPEGDYDPTVWTANTLKYPWAVNPFNYNNTLVTTEQPIRTASQIAEWMYRMGYSIDISDGKFINLMPGDLIFWARKNSDGSWKQPNRFKHISHVAICASVKPIPTNDPAFPEGYFAKHTTFEVTSTRATVVNRVVEKHHPEDIVMVCRPDFSVESRQRGFGTTYTDDLNTLIYPGIYILSSSITKGVPEDLPSAIHCSLIVENSYAGHGTVNGIVQRLIEASKNKEYRRTQYCYSHLPNFTSWTAWKEVTSAGDIKIEVDSDELSAALAEVLV